MSQLLWSAQGVTDTETGYRTAPSAGGTFPLETYLVAGAVDGLEPGVYHYDPAAHSLDQTAEGDIRPELAEACMNQNLRRQLRRRHPVRHGDRADGGRNTATWPRDLVLLEAGHAAQNVSLQAVDLELGAVAIGALDATKTRAATGMGSEAEPVYMMVMGKPAQ